MYCYQHPIRDAGNLPKEYDMEAMKKAVMARNEPFSLFGGEALLVPLDDLEEIFSWSFTKYGRASIQTNGTLITDDHIKLFKKYNVSVGISMDGPFELNDTRWAGSLEKTRDMTLRSMNAIGLCIDAGIYTSLIITLQKNNATKDKLPILKEWIRDLDKKGLKSARLHMLEIDNGVESFALSTEETVSALFELTQLELQLENLKFDLFQDMIWMLKGEDHKATCIWRACYDDQTEVLTKNGFKFFKDVDISTDLIASLNPKTGIMSYLPATEKQELPFSGKLMHWNTRSLNLAVTPDHRMLVYGNDFDNDLNLIFAHFKKSGLSKRAFARKIGVPNMSLSGWLSRKYKTITPHNRARLIAAGILPEQEGKHPLLFIPAHKLQGTHIRIKKDAIWEGVSPSTFTFPPVRNTKKRTSVNINDYLKFMGWYLSEGSVSVHKQKHGTKYEICISQLKPSYRLEIFHLLKRMGFAPYYKKTSVCTTSIQLGQYLSPFGKSYEKFVPQNIKDMSSDLIEVFLEAFFKGDGHFENGKMRSVSTVSQRLANDLQELFLKVGLSSSCRKYNVKYLTVQRADYKLRGGTSFSANYDQYKISVNHKKCRPLVDQFPSTVDYVGMVYDLTVPPNGTLFVRRSGKVLWCSNCDPYTTDAVQGINGKGEQSNCGRTNKDGVDFVKAEQKGYERYVGLYHAPQETGGCSGCRFFMMCKGDCVGTGQGGDWRNKTTHCEVNKTLYSYFEKLMVKMGMTPLSLHPKRKELEALMVDRFANGQNVLIRDLLKMLNGETVSEVPTTGHGDGVVHLDSSASIQKTYTETKKPHAAFHADGNLIHTDSPHGDKI